MKSTQTSSILERLSWPVYSAAILCLCVFFQAMQWPLFPKFLDIYYHLSVMKGFADAGGYVARAFWEYAPTGRPHLYPPVLHILMLFLYKAGLEPITIGRFLDCISYPLFLFSFYRLASRSFSKRAAFLSLLMMSAVFSVALASMTLTAFNLSVVFGLWALGFVEDEKPLGVALCLVLCFYTHTLAAWLFLLTLVIYSLFNKEKIGAVSKTAAGALLMAAPFLAYQFHFREYFSFVKVHEFRRWEFDALTGLLSLCGAVFFWRSRSLKNAALPLALVIGFSPLIATHPTRFFNGHGLMGPALLAGIFLDDRFRAWGKKWPSNAVLAAFAAFTLFAMLAGPYLEWNVRERQGRWVWGDRTVTRYLWPDEKNNFRAQGFSIYFPEDYAKIAEAVRAHSGPEDILWTDFSYTAGILGVLVGRATSCAMLAEVKPYEKSNHLQDARILVWFKDKDLRASAEMEQAIRKYHFSVLKETEMAFVLENPSGYGKRSLPKPLIPTAGLFFLLGSAFCSIFFVSLSPKK